MIKTKYENGFVLLLMLLFLAILSVSAFAILDINLLETKSAAIYQDKIRSFYLAESELLKAENSLMLNKTPQNVKFKFIDSNNCKVNFFHLTVEAKHRNAKTVLQSVIAVPSNKSDCDLEVEIKYGRQLFVALKD